MLKRQTNPTHTALSVPLFLQMRIYPFKHKDNIRYFNETKEFKQRTSIRNKLNAEFYNMKTRLKKNGVFALGIILLNLFSISTVLAQTITTGTISGSPFCSGSAVSVPYTITGAYIPGNIFTAQLSDGSGSFASPVSIGTLTSTLAGYYSRHYPGRYINRNRISNTGCEQQSCCNGNRQRY